MISDECKMRRSKADVMLPFYRIPRCLREGGGPCLQELHGMTSRAPRPDAGDATSCPVDPMLPVTGDGSVRNGVRSGRQVAK
jgi:hypothetical protein